jgi:hypothetical protein
MKILRTLVLLLGALSSVTGFTKEKTTPPPATKPCDEVISKRPDDYVLVATMQMLDTMKGKKNLVEWSCYVQYDADKDKPLYRTTAWLEGVIKRAPGETVGIDLFDIGAQHRDHTLKLRVLPKSPEHRLVTVDKKENELTTEVADAEGFYCIEPGVAYRLKSKHNNLQLEAFYPDHLPGTTKKQHEDGGPPAVPPVNEN